MSWADNEACGSWTSDWSQGQRGDRGPQGLSAQAPTCSMDCHCTLHPKIITRHWLWLKYTRKHQLKRHMAVNQGPLLKVRGRPPLLSEGSELAGHIAPSYKTVHISTDHVLIQDHYKSMGQHTHFKKVNYPFYRQCCKWCCTQKHNKVFC